jgi:hypothetical protein
MLITHSIAVLFTFGSADADRSFGMSLMLLLVIAAGIYLLIDHCVAHWLRRVKR